MNRTTDSGFGFGSDSNGMNSGAGGGTYGGTNGGGCTGDGRDSGHARAIEKKLCSKLSGSQLRRTITLAYQNRWIAEWLFPTMSSPTAHPPLTPEVFEQGLTVHMSQTLNEADYDQILRKGGGGSSKMIYEKESNLLVVPVCGQGKTTAGYVFCNGHKFTQMTGYQPVSHMMGDLLMSRFVYDTQERQLLVVSPIPAEGIVGILQIVFHCDGSCERNFLQVPFLHYTADSLPTVILSSQCNLETRDLSSSPPPSNDFSNELNSSSTSTFKSATFMGQPLHQPQPSAPMSTTTSSNGTGTSTGSGAVPEMNASMDDLLSQLTSLERPFSPSDNIPLDLGAADPLFDPFAPSALDDDVSGGGVSSGVDGDDSGMPGGAGYPVPYTPPTSWPFTSDGSTADGVGVPRKPGTAPTSCGSFDMSEMNRALAKLERNMKGSFSCLRAKHDLIDPNTGELIKRQTGHQISHITSLNAFESAKLRHIAAQTYYASTLSARVDASLVTPTITRAAERLVLPPLPALPQPIATSAVSALPTSQALVSTPSVSPVMAPTVAPVALAPRPGLDGSGPQSAIDKAEAKKIRNRLSAAKSNQRRRAQLEAQRKELATLQQRVIELRRTKGLMEEENGRLRSMVFGPMAPV